MRKAAREFAGGRTEKIVVGKKDLIEYLGQPLFTPEEIFEGVPGVVTGLAWTSMGGATLPIEATAMPSKSKGSSRPANSAATWSKAPRSPTPTSWPT
jgi:ATP-dependent Lon protease